MFNKRSVILIGLIILFVVLDQILKLISIHYLKDQGSLIYFNDFIRLEYAENKGAFLSLGAGMSDSLRFFVLNILVTGVVLFLMYELFKKPLDPVKVTAYVLIVAGGIGNLIDRYFRGYVVDFANMGIGPIRTGIFNLADVFIMAALVLLLLPEKWALKMVPKPKVQ